MTLSGHTACLGYQGKAKGRGALSVRKRPTPPEDFTAPVRGHSRCDDHSLGVPSMVRPKRRPICRGLMNVACAGPRRATAALTNRASIPRRALAQVLAKARRPCRSKSVEQVSGSDWRVGGTCSAFSRWSTSKPSSSSPHAPTGSPFRLTRSHRRNAPDDPYWPRKDRVDADG